jgi:hypothetical protein
MPAGLLQLLVRVAQPHEEVRLARMPLLIARLHVPMGVEPLENAADLPLRPRHFRAVNLCILSHDAEASIISLQRWHPEVRLMEGRNALMYA